ncbi:1 phosphatidylinositol 4,5 bisphosphate [Trichuris trichiura]|uniref:Phosphoinositide phospholipase C n=1 Tax=Trichuris trichiura TaxID=36087 RepID=A0A077YYY2_TRITR|nr:1 phosphatidylinositol 4,5 bisphosphate [Trichuris trichiura]
MPALSPGDGDHCSLDERKARDILFKRTEKALKNGEDIFVLKLIARLKSQQARHDWQQLHEPYDETGTSFIDSGSQRRLTTKSLQTCLDYCFRLAVVYQRKEVVELLLKSGLHPDHLINCDCFDDSKEGGHERALVDASALQEEQAHVSLRQSSLNGQLPSSLLATLTSPSCIDCRPLILAVETKNVDIVSLLCRYNASVDITDSQSASASFFRATFEQKGGVAHVDLAKLFVEIFSSIQAALIDLAIRQNASFQNRTALLAAVQLSPLPLAIVEILLEHGARIGPSRWSSAAPVDLMPELFRMQKTLIKDLVHKAILLWKANGLEKSPPDQDEKSQPTMRITNRYSESESVKHSPSKQSGRTGQALFYVTSGSPKTSRPSGLQSQSPSGFACKEESDGVIKSLKCLVNNPECLQYVADALLQEEGNILLKSHHNADNCELDERISQLLEEILAVALKEYEGACLQSGGRKEAASISNSKVHDLFKSIVRFCLLLLTKGGSCSRFTAFHVLNQVIDICICKGFLAWPKVKFLSTELLSMQCPPGVARPRERRSLGECPKSRTNQQPKRKNDSVTIDQTSNWRKEALCDILEPLSNLEPNVLVMLLHNALTMEKRSGDVKYGCLPSRRSRRCAHCSLILCARILLFLCHQQEIRKQLADPQNVRLLVQMLDVTLEPQFLCYLLQIVATLALDRKTRCILRDLRVDELLVQMLLPGDEWYYTNQTMIFPKVVKHHAARILIYIGRGHMVGNRVNLFTCPNVANLVDSSTNSSESPLIKELHNEVEDRYILKTCLSPQFVETAGGTTLYSVEGLLMKLLNTVGDIPEDANSKISQSFLSWTIALVDPLLLLRLLLHKFSWDVGFLQYRGRSSSGHSFGVPAGQVQKSKSFDRQLPKTLHGESDTNSMLRSGSMRTDNVKLPRPRCGRGSLTASETCSEGIRTKSNFSKYIQNLFRTKRAKMNSIASTQSNQNSDTESLLEFQKKLQNLPPRCSMDEDDVNYFSSLPLKVVGQKDGQSICFYPNDSECSVCVENSAGQTRSDANTENAGNACQSLAVPQIQIEIRRASVLSQFSVGQGLSSSAVEYLPLLTAPTNVSRRSSATTTTPYSCTSQLSSQRSSVVSSLVFSNSSSPLPTSDHVPFVFNVTTPNRRASSVISIMPRISVRSLADRPILSADMSTLKIILECIINIFGRANDGINDVLKETKNLFGKIMAVTEDMQVKEWCAVMMQFMTIKEVMEESEVYNPDRLGDEYFELQDQIASGSLPCSKEEAALLASIQSLIEEKWPSSKRQLSRLLSYRRLREISQKISTLTWDSENANPPLLIRPLLFSMNKEKARNSFKEQSQKNVFNRLLCKTLSLSINAEALEHCLPANYRESKQIIKLIQVWKRKLFHSNFYDSEKGLKHLYVQTCKRLPAFGCKLFHVKELYRGKLIRKSRRILCLGAAYISLLRPSTKTLIRKQKTVSLLRWHVGSGSTDRSLTLDFGTTKWYFIGNVREVDGFLAKTIGMTLWELVQINTPKTVQKAFSSKLEEAEPPSAAFHLTGADGLPVMFHGLFVSESLSGFLEESATLYSLELERLQSVFYFPEEVAFQLSAIEYDLVYSISPMDYVTYVICDLNQVRLNLNPSQVRMLIKRFAEVSTRRVSSWVTHLILSQPSHEDRRNMLCFIVRAAETCWNIGNFNGATEILYGLSRKFSHCNWLCFSSEKLQPFWLSLSADNKRKFMNLSEILLSQEPSTELRKATQRALSCGSFRPIPFFGTFLKDLYTIFQSVPSLVPGEKAEDRDATKVEKTSASIDSSLPDHSSSFFSEHIGVTSFLNSQKIELIQTVLDNLETFHSHSRSRHSNEKGDEGDQTDSSRTLEIIQPLTEMPSPTLMSLRRIDADLMQRLQHGCSVIYYECETARSAFCHLHLDTTCSYIKWQKSNFSSWLTTTVGKGGADNLDPLSTVGSECKEASSSSELDARKVRATSGQPPVLSSSSTSADDFSKRIKLLSGIPAYRSMEDGLIVLTYVKSVEICNNPDFDILAVYQRHCTDTTVPPKCFSVVYGGTLTDNYTVYFVAPEMTASVLTDGLAQILNELKAQYCHHDRRLFWLRKLYLDLLSADQNFLVAANPSTALQAFGGRAFWTDQLSAFGSPSEHSSPTFKKTKSVRYPSQRGYLPTAKLKKLSVTGDQGFPSRVRLSIRNSFRLSPGSSQDSGSRVNSILASSKMTSEAKAQSSGESKKSTLASLVSPSTMHKKSIGDIQENPLNFLEFTELFKLFSIRMRKDLRDLFKEQVRRYQEQEKQQQPHSFLKSDSKSSICDIHLLPSHSAETSDKKNASAGKDADPFMNDAFIDKLMPDQLMRQISTSKRIADKQMKIYDALATASIAQNSAGVDTSRSMWLTAAAVKSFMRIHQMEPISDAQAVELIARHEPDAVMRSKQRMSFEGFARFLLDSSNFAYLNEDNKMNKKDMDYPLSYYFIASSHNTYLTGHQLKGESSVELYRQILMTGCRCIEFDCWDGDDGQPVIYHGHTLTTKINFRQVVEIVRRSAFEVSSLPVIISIENHCSLPLQAKMAQTFKSVFGERLVSQFLFENDLSDNPKLPSPLQLKGKVLIKNKKLSFEPPPPLGDRSSKVDGHKPQKGSLMEWSMEEEEDEETQYDFDDNDEDDDEVNRETKVADAGVNKLSPSSKLQSNKLYKSKDDSASSDTSSTKNDPAMLATTHGNLVTPPQYGSELTASSEELYKASGKKSGGPVPQVAPELSDLVIYCQAVKFKGFAISGDVELTQKRAATSSVKKTGNSGQPVPASPAMDFASSENVQTHAYRPPCFQVSCYQLPSMNETTAKKLIRKHPLELVAFTKDHILRTYPSAVRIDSSNFNPLMFWTFGIQMVALNYQTQDIPMAINAAMFEQNGNCGYMLKPRVMWDEAHPLYGIFNPWAHDLRKISGIRLILNIISGQFVCPGQADASPYVEVELMGIEADSWKERTKTVQRNGLNPIWLQTFQFQVNFLDLCFLRLAVIESGNNKCTAQRVVPLKALRAGYRHVRLRSPNNSPLEYSSIFIYSRMEEEEFIYVDGDSTENKLQTLPQNGEIPIFKQQIYVLKIYGVCPDGSSTTVQAQSTTVAREVIDMALKNCGHEADLLDDYVLMEDLWIPEASTTCQVQVSRRVLEPDELIMNAVANWNGANGRFVLRKKGSDPSSRAWMNTIIRSSKEKLPKQSCKASERSEITFLVCVHNVSEDQDYAILRVPVNSTASDIVSQVLIKARRTEQSSAFVLVEETEEPVGAMDTSSGGGKTFIASSSGATSSKAARKKTRRILSNDTNVFALQMGWKTPSRFLLEKRTNINEAQKVEKPKSNSLNVLRSLNLRKKPPPAPTAQS